MGRPTSGRSTRHGNAQTISDRPVDARRSYQRSLGKVGFGDRAVCCHCYNLHLLNFTGHNSASSSFRPVARATDCAKCPCRPGRGHRHRPCADVERGRMPTSPTPSPTFLPSPSPSPLPTPTPFAGLGATLGFGTNLRDGPSTRFLIVDFLDLGETMLILGLPKTVFGLRQGHRRQRRLGCRNPVHRSARQGARPTRTRNSRS